MREIKKAWDKAQRNKSRAADMLGSEEQVPLHDIGSYSDAEADDETAEEQELNENTNNSKS